MLAAMSQPTASATKPIPVLDRDFEAYREQMDAAFLTSTAGGGSLFTTDADGLWAAFLAAFPEHDRQVYTCMACRHFIERFGGLVTIDGGGRTSSVMWSEGAAPPFAAMRRVVQRAGVTGVFLSSLSEWGQHSTGAWTHLAVRPARPFKHAVLDAGQAAAEKGEDWKTVRRALAEFPLPLVEIALRVLESDQVYRAEKIIGPARWLRDVHVAMDAAPKTLRDNVLWRAVAAAPAGFCHPRASMVGTLLEDIATGAPFEAVARRFGEKMHPLQYQRPTAAPAAGNIAQAEKVIEALGATASLRRRYARLDEVIQHAVWSPPAPKADALAGGGVFAHLAPKGKVAPRPMSLPTAEVTWVKFARDVLPTAERIECVAPVRGSYMALVTAADPAAPPIIQWDAPERRNPVNWYLYSGGSLASQWGLGAGTVVPVVAILPLPTMWGEFPMPHHGEGMLFMLAGCRDQSSRVPLCLFPETLRSEFHGVRATIEAFSRTRAIEGQEASTANGLDLRKGAGLGAELRVTSRGVVASYKIDRWE